MQLETKSSQVKSATSTVVDDMSTIGQWLVLEFQGYVNVFFNKFYYEGNFPEQMQD